MRAALVAAAGLVAALAGTGTIPGPPAAASSAAVTHYAALVVDTGTDVRRVCVGFPEDEISGKDLLDRAGVDPVYRPYGSKGAAVCALCGTGCPPDESCLTCGGGDYWAYHRAPAGRDRFSPSSVGASSTRVGHGDVDGWRWGSGGAPPYASFEEVCGVAVATTTSSTAPAPPVPAPTAPPPPAPREAPRGGTVPPTSAAPPPPSTTSTTTVTPSTTEPRRAGVAAAPRAGAGDDEGEGGSARSLAAFGVAFTGMCTWVALARRARLRRLGGG